MALASSMRQNEPMQRRALFMLFGLLAAVLSARVDVWSASVDFGGTGGSVSLNCSLPGQAARWARLPDGKGASTGACGVPVALPPLARDVPALSEGILRARTRARLPVERVFPSAGRTSRGPPLSGLVT